MVARVWWFLHTRPIHLNRPKAHSWHKPNSTKTFFTHSSQVCQPLPLSITHYTLNLDFTILSLHMTKPSQSASSNHNCMNAFSTKQTVPYGPSHPILAVNTTHIHQTFVRSILSNPPYPPISQPKFHLHMPRHSEYLSVHFERNSPWC